MARQVARRRSIPFSAAFVQNIKRPGSYGDGRGGHGLRLRIRERTGGGVTKYWFQRLRVAGQTLNLGLGAYPVLSLAEARKQALANRRSAAQGRDPRAEKREIPTFAQAAEEVVGLREPNWKDAGLEASIWRSSFQRYVNPTLGTKRVDAVSAADVMQVLAPLWREKQETARRVKQRISAVMRLAVALGHRRDNPAGEAISQNLPLRRTARKHYAALPYSEVGAALTRVRASRAYKATILCFEFLVLTAARSGEARLAEWAEIDFDSTTWTIPETRMKMGRPHRVPLSPRAVEILRAAEEIADGTGLVFPSPTHRALSNMTMSKLMKDLRIVAVPHGFRASFRTWAEEDTDAPRAVMEAALAHKLGDLAEQAYARSDLFAKRRALMNDWANYLEDG